MARDPEPVDRGELFKRREADLYIALRKHSGSWIGDPELGNVVARSRLGKLSAVEMARAIRLTFESEIEQEKHSLDLFGESTEEEERQSRMRVAQILGLAEDFATHLGSELDNLAQKLRAEYAPLLDEESTAALKRFRRATKRTEQGGSWLKPSMGWALVLVILALLLKPSLESHTNYLESHTNYVAHYPDLIERADGGPEYQPSLPSPHHPDYVELADSGFKYQPSLPSLPLQLRSVKKRIRECPGTGVSLRARVKSTSPPGYPHFENEDFTSSASQTPVDEDSHESSQNPQERPAPRDVGGSSIVIRRLIPNSQILTSSLQKQRAPSLTGTGLAIRVPVPSGGNMAWGANGGGVAVFESKSRRTDTVDLETKKSAGQPSKPPVPMGNDSENHLACRKLDPCSRSEKDRSCQ